MTKTKDAPFLIGLPRPVYSTHFLCVAACIRPFCHFCTQTQPPRRPEPRGQLYHPSSQDVTFHRIRKVDTPSLSDPDMEFAITHFMTSYLAYIHPPGYVHRLLQWTAPPSGTSALLPIQIHFPCHISSLAHRGNTVADFRPAHDSIENPGHYAGLFGHVTALVYPDRVYLDPSAEVSLYHPQQLMLLHATPANAPAATVSHDIYATRGEPFSLSYDDLLLVPGGQPQGTSQGTPPSTTFLYDISPPIQATIPMVITPASGRTAFKLPDGRAQWATVRAHFTKCLHDPSATCPALTRLIALRDKYAPPQSRLTLDTRQLVYAIAHRRHSNRIYIGLTENSLWERFQGHVSKAKEIAKKPTETQRFFNPAYRLLDVMNKYGLDDLIIVPLQIVRTTPWLGTGQDFIAAYDHIEIMWYREIAQTIFPRGYNKLGDNINHRARNRATHQRQRDKKRAQLDNTSDPPLTSPTPSSPPSPPPLHPSLHPTPPLTRLIYTSSSSSHPSLSSSSSSSSSAFLGTMLSPPPPPPGSPNPTDEPGETPSSSARGALGVGQQRQTLPAPLEEVLESSHGRRIISGGPLYASYARIAFNILQSLHAYAAGLNPDCDLPSDHPIIQELNRYPHTVLDKTLHALGEFSLRELNLLRPKQDASAILWDPHVVQFLTHCINAYTKCSLHSSDSGGPPSRKLIIAKFTTPALDSAGIGRILRECQPHIPVHYRETAGEPLLVFKYDRPIGRQWINTKKYADLSKEAMTIMCQTDCNCHLIPGRFKKDGHLLTTSPELLPSLRVQKLASMGSKYRPSPYPGEFNSTT